MTRKPPLPKGISEKINSILGDAGDLFRDGETERSIEKQIKAWNLIPEPRVEWDFYPQTMSKNLVITHVAAKDLSGAKKWINTTYDMYEDPEKQSHYVLMLEGESLYKLEQFGDAYSVFERIYALYAREGFLGEQLEFLEFYLKEKARRE